MGVADRPNQLDYEPALHRALRGAAHDWPRVPAQVLRVKSAAVTHLGGAGGDSSEAGGKEPQVKQGPIKWRPMTFPTWPQASLAPQL